MGLMNYTGKCKAKFLECWFCIYIKFRKPYSHLLPKTSVSMGNLDFLKDFVNISNFQILHQSWLCKRQSNMFIQMILFLFIVWGLKKIQFNTPKFSLKKKKKKEKYKQLSLSSTVAKSYLISCDEFSNNSEAKRIKGRK